jgi:23S rRNA (uridine2552-2'-O)-methyltransferase
MLSRRDGPPLNRPNGYGQRPHPLHDMGKAWIKARKHDRFYRAAKKQAYRSRAAIKLSQIDLRYGVFHEGDVVVDLGAAPGGWSQVARERIGAKGRVVAVDLARVALIEGVEILRGDFTRPDVQASLFEAIRRPADVVMSDMAPKLSGNRSLDVARTLELADAALSFAVRALRPGGTFLAKVFQGEGYPAFLRRVGERFAGAKGVKPSASAPTSSEIYVLAIGRL